MTEMKNEASDKTKNGGGKIINIYKKKKRRRFSRHRGGVVFWIFTVSVERNEKVRDKRV